MTAALEHDGETVGVAADSLERMLRDPSTRRYIGEGRLTLITPFNPAAGFTVANAMARNKLVYSLADFAVVAASSQESGGTRAGALENLKLGWVPLFVRSGENVPAGNDDLIRRGGIPVCLDAMPTGQHLAPWLEQQARQRAATAGPARAPARNGDLPARQNASTDDRPARTATAPPEPALPVGADDLYEINWPHLDRYLQEWRTPEQIGAFHRLERSQVNAWLTRALEDGRVKKRQRPVAYRAAGRIGMAIQHAMPLVAPSEASNGR
jgi:predicted Rossmann fold nucleotide-binding protein DprA/Smf involved in DNA uptake